MPEFIPKNQEPIWVKAKAAFKKSYNREPSKSNDYAIVASLFQKMGGRVASEAYEMLEKFVEEVPNRDHFKETERNRLLNLIQKAKSSQIVTALEQEAQELFESGKLSSLDYADIKKAIEVWEAKRFDAGYGESFKRLSEDITSEDDGHRHVWHHAQIYTAEADGHQHKLDINLDIALEADGHTHRLLRDVTDVENTESFKESISTGDKVMILRKDDILNPGDVMTVDREILRKLLDIIEV